MLPFAVVLSIAVLPTRAAPYCVPAPHYCALTPPPVACASRSALATVSAVSGTTSKAICGGGSPVALSMISLDQSR